MKSIILKIILADSLFRHTGFFSISWTGESKLGSSYGFCGRTVSFLWVEEIVWGTKSLRCAQGRIYTVYLPEWVEKHLSYMLLISLTGSSQNPNKINLKNTIYITDLSDLECLFKLQFIMYKPYWVHMQCINHQPYKISYIIKLN